MSVNTEAPVIERLREWLMARNKDLMRDALSLDFDLIEARAVDSLSSLEFVLFIEELSGRELDMNALKVTNNFRTLRSIYDTFLSHLTPAAAGDYSDDTNILSAAAAQLARESLGRAADTTRRPLAYSQARYWNIQQVRPGSTWNVPAIVRIKGPLDMAVFRECLGELVRRHDALRITFRVVDGQPVQELVAPFMPEIQTIQLESGLADPWQEALQVVERENAHPCDLSAGPPWYVRMIRIAEEDHVCLLSLEKLIADLESLLTVPKELGKIYASLTGSDEVPPPGLQFSDFSDWHEAWLQTDFAKVQIDHRQEQFADARPVDFGPQEGTTTRGERESHQRQISLDTTARLESLVADEGATPVAIAMSAAATMLYRRFQQKDIVLMMVSSYRTTATSGVLGNFTNQLPLRIKVSADMSFRDLVRQVRGTIIDAIKHRDLPTEVVLDTHNPLGHPLAAVLVNWMNLVDYGKNMTEVRVGETSFETVMLGAGGTSNVYGAPFATLIVRAIRNPQGTSVRITTDNDVLASGTSASIAEEVGSLLETVALDPDLKVSATFPLRSIDL